MVKRLLIFTLLAACTPGGIAPSNTGGTTLSRVTRIEVSISAYGQTATTAGTSLGFSPAQTAVTVGSGVQFVNTDNTSHTATSIAGDTYPGSSPLTFAATTQSGDTLSGGFTSGTLQPGQSSVVLLVDRPGTYLYGCFFHYSGGMRGEIIAR